MKNEMNSTLSRVVSVYEDRYPTLFGIKRTEAKDDVHFVFNAAR